LTPFRQILYHKASPQSVEEKAVLEMIEAEPNPFNETKNGTQAEPEIETVLANSHDL
jgi:hypothetical protein